MKQAATAALIALAGLTGGAAQAATVYVHLDGYLISQVGPGEDANLAVGDKLTLTAEYDTANSTYLGPDLNFSIVSPTTLFITSGGADNWQRRDEVSDGSTISLTYGEDYYDPDGTYHGAYYVYGYPVIAVRNGKVAGVGGFFAPTNTSVIPALSAGDVGGYISKVNSAPGEPVVTTIFGGLSGPEFTIQEFFAYGNTAQTPGFNGLWDFANSTVAVPEPATWAMMITGFLGVGIFMRRNGRTAVHA